MKAILEKAKEKNELVSLYSDLTHISRCSVGYVDCVDDRFVRLKAVARSGKQDGYIIRNLSSIFKIGMKGEYENKISMLKDFEYKDSQFSECRSEVMLQTLLNAKKNRMCVSLFFNESEDSVVGIVKSADPQNVEIQSITDNGEDDGILFIKFDSIDSANLNSEDEQMIEYLHSRSSSK